MTSAGLVLEHLADLEDAQEAGQAEDAAAAGAERPGACSRWTSVDDPLDANEWQEGQ